MVLLLAIVVLLNQVYAQTADCSNIPNLHGEGHYNLGKLIGLEYVQVPDSAPTLHWFVLGLKPIAPNMIIFKPLFVVLASPVAMLVPKVPQDGLCSPLTVSLGDGGYCEFYDNGLYSFDDCLGKFLVARSLRM